MTTAKVEAFKKAFHTANNGRHKGDYDACVEAGLRAVAAQDTKLDPGQTNVVKAALHELHLKWERKGTANAGLSDYSMNLLRGDNGPRPHEGTGSMILGWLDHFDLVLVRR